MQKKAEQAAEMIESFKRSASGKDFAAQTEKVETKQQEVQVRLSRTLKIDKAVQTKWKRLVDPSSDAAKAHERLLRLFDNWEYKFK